MASASLGVLSLAHGAAHACGVSAAGVASCSLAEHDDATRPRFALGASGQFTSTRLSFGQDLKVDQTRYAALSTFAYLPTARLVLQAGAGAAFGGSLSAPNGEHRFSPGPIALLGADFRVFDDGRGFVLLTSGLSFTTARSHLSGQADAAPDANYTALDLRVGAQFGLELARIVRPYLLARVFGGPVFWHYRDQAVTGTDTHHYQLGGGLAIRASKAINLFAEGVPLGERAIVLGVGFAL